MSELDIALMRLIKSHDFASEVTLRMISVLFIDGPMNEHALTIRMRGYNPSRIHMQLQKLAADGWCAPFPESANLWSVTESARQVLGLAGLVTRPEWRTKLDHARVYFDREILPLLPPAHPRSFEWRFSIDGLIALAEQIYNDAPLWLTQSVGALNTPLFGLFLWTIGMSARVTIYDRNQHMLRLAKDLSSGQIEVVNIEADRLAATIQPAQHRVVVMDPPWFPDYYSTYVDVLGQITLPPARIYALLQPELTQEYTLSERFDIIQTFMNRGFVPLDYRPSAIGYQLSPFEKVTYSTFGITDSAEWSQGDLFVVASPPQRSHPTFTANEVHPDDWVDYYLPSQVVSIKRPDVSTEHASVPVLTSAGANGVLPSVSSKEREGLSYNVWTSDNRIYVVQPATVFHDLCRRIETATLDRNQAIKYLVDKGATEVTATRIIDTLFHAEDLLQKR